MNNFNDHGRTSPNSRPRMGGVLHDAELLDDCALMDSLTLSQFANGLEIADPVFNDKRFIVQFFPRDLPNGEVSHHSFDQMLSFYAGTLAQPYICSFRMDFFDTYPLFNGIKLTGESGSYFISYDFISLMKRFIHRYKKVLASSAC